MTHFKKTEWTKDATKFKLATMLEEYYMDFGLELTGWTEKAIRNFLHINHWLYNTPHYYNHHINTIKSIIMEITT